MRSKPYPAYLLPLLFALAALAAPVAWHARAESPGSGPFWYSVVPPLVAVGLALLTHRVLLSLGLAVVVGGLLTHVPPQPGAPAAWAEGVGQAGRYAVAAFTRTELSRATAAGAVAGPAVFGVGEVSPGAGPFPEDIYVGALLLDWSKVKILAFVVLMLAAIAVMVVSGGLQGVVNRFIRLARGARSTQLVTALTGLIVFIDDYANTMIVGNSMRPLCDKNRVSREKLAFLVDATSAPVAGIALVSTWIGYEVGLFGNTARDLGLEIDGYSIFLSALPFYFYCILMLAFVFVNAGSGKDYGPMAPAERRARRGEPPPWLGRAGAAAPTTAEPHPEARSYAAAGLVPLGGLILTLLVGLWIDGGSEILREDSSALLRAAAWREAFGNADLNLILMLAAGVGLVLAAGFAVALAGLPPSAVGRAVAFGVRGSLVPMAILTLAWALNATCDGMQTGDFLGETVRGFLSPTWFPALVFVVAGATAFATGTSWGTLAILIPLTFELAFR
ncbi:MAG TPA: Na+/H+ antiporter NhaC family protein, partial [Gemmataceae bacterium]